MDYCPFRQLHILNIKPNFMIMLFVIFNTTALFRMHNISNYIAKYSLYHNDSSFGVIIGQELWVIIVHMSFHAVIFFSKILSRVFA